MIFLALQILLSERKFTYLLTYFYFLTKLFFVTIKIHYGLIMKLEIYLEKRDIRTVYNQWKISNRLRAVAID